MSIKQWFKNLKKQSERFSLVEYHTEELEKAENFPAGREWDINYHKEKLVKSYPKEIDLLKSTLRRAYTERKTPTKIDIQVQLCKFSEACEAKAHQKLLGVSEHSEMSKIVNEAWSTEFSKLLYLCFDDVDVPLEYVEQKIAEYKREIQDD